MSMGIRVGSKVARKVLGMDPKIKDRARSVKRKWEKGEPVFVADTEKNRLAGRRVTEEEISAVVVNILHDRPNGRATIAELVHEIPKHITMSIADLVRSPSRPHEAIWQQQVRNITSHRASPGNAIYEGKLRIVRGGLALKHAR